MRIAALVVLTSFACVRELRSANPDAWVELQSEHFVLRTDLPPVEARQAISDLEVVRAALFAAGWHGDRRNTERTLVVELASKRELQEFVRKGVEGFFGLDVFGQPILVGVAEDVFDQVILKHELMHMINATFLVTQPRWVQEGIACYLETLRFDGRKKELIRGEPRRERLEYLSRNPIRDWFTQVINIGDRFWQMSDEEGYRFETAAWALVHWLVDTRPEKFDAFLRRLGRGENEWVAFSAEFPDLHAPEVQGGMREYLKTSKMSVSRLPMASWSGNVQTRLISPADAHALRAELFKISPSGVSREERDRKVQAELSIALAADPGNPLALLLSQHAELRPAIELHPDDWRAWLVWYDRHHESEAIGRAAQLAPEDPGVLWRLAISEQNSGNPAAALRHAAQAAELGPGRSDVLDALASVYAANGRCSEAADAEQRAIYALPDSSSRETPTYFRERLSEIANHCAALPQEREASRTVVVQPMLRSCSLPPPRARSADAALTAQFTIRKNGSVSGVTMKGNAAKPVMAAFKRYVESCTFDPVVVDGKALEPQISVELRALLN
jgi:tetratricopeptide (TPR) repeat protein